MAASRNYLGTQYQIHDNEEDLGTQYQIHDDEEDLGTQYQIHENEEATPFCFLPDEMTVKIFSYLDQSDLISLVSLVCKFWLKLAIDPSLWMTLNLNSCNKVTSHGLCKFLMKIPGVKRLLNIQKVSDLSAGIVTDITVLLPSLLELDFSFSQLTFLGLMAIVNNCSKLETLNLEGCECHIDNKYVRTLCRAEHLRNLNLSHCILTDQQLVYISENSDEIHSLDINGVLHISDVSMTVLLNKHSNCLQELTLDGEELSDDTVHLVSKCYKLQKLQIFFCELLTDLSLQYLQKLENLRHLTLRKGPGFSTEAFQVFFQECDISHLRSLDVSDCPDISDEVVLAICQRCGPCIKNLNLSWCWYLSDRSLISIIDHCRNLVELRLIGVDIKGDCLHRLPEEMTNMTFCDFENCSFVNDEVLEDIVLRKPDLVIMNYYAEKLTSSLD